MRLQRLSACVRSLVVMCGVALGAVLACVPRPAPQTFNSKLYVTPAKPIVRLLVHANVKGEAFNALMYSGFQAALANRLLSCGVTSKIMHREHAEYEESVRITQELKQFQPGAMLTMRVEAAGMQRRGNVTGVGLILVYQMADATPAEIWQAKSEFDFQLVDDYDSGRRASTMLATELVARLRSDGVLLHCPATWDAGDLELCRQQRSQALSDAYKMADEAERRAGLKAVFAAPACEQ